MKILIVDDVLDTREMFQMAFQIEGHAISLASNGLEAIEAVRAEVFDVLVIDAEMPFMTGWDAVRNIRELDNGAHLPIVLFMAYGDDEYLRHAKEAGADLIVLTPIFPADLLAQVKELVASRSGTAI